MHYFGSRRTRIKSTGRNWNREAVFGSQVWPRKSPQKWHSLHKINGESSMNGLITLFNFNKFFYLIPTIDRLVKLD